MKKENPAKIPPLIDRDIRMQNFSYNEVSPRMDYQVDAITNLGAETEKRRLELIVQLIRKRKHIRDITVGRLEELIVYCDNRILDIAPDEFKLRGDPDANRAASMWQKTIVDIEKDKIFEQKELFRDVLFLRNEWVKSLLAYTEEKKLEDILGSIEGNSVVREIQTR